MKFVPENSAREVSPFARQRDFDSVDLKQINELLMALEINNDF
jgi:hypothetical protein